MPPRPVPLRLRRHRSGSAPRLPELPAPPSRPAALLARFAPLFRPSPRLPLLFALVALGACAAQAPGRFATVAPTPGAPAPIEPPRARVAVLLPLSGAQAPLGQSMLNAATLALFEQAGPAVELVPRDTGSTPNGAAEAARGALADGARAIVGPLTAAESGTVANAARAAGVPVLAFTNDGNLAGRGVWVLGVTPAQQVRRLVQAAQAEGMGRLALAGPNGPFAQQLAAGLRAASQEAGLPPPAVVTYPQAAALPMAARELLSQLGENAAGQPPGLLVLAEGGARARAFAAALREAAPPDAVLPRIAGTVLWAQEVGTLSAEPALAGAWFPSTDNAARTQFESRYQGAFGQRPPRLAAVAYDAAALASRAARGGPDAPLALPVGEIVFGADGALRLLPDGQTQRALAIYGLEPGAAEPTQVQPASLPGAAGS